MLAADGGREIYGPNQAKHDVSRQVACNNEPRHSAALGATQMSEPIKATFDGKIFRPIGPATLPVNTEVDVMVSDEPSSSRLDNDV